jgi:hypothetical protein
MASFRLIIVAAVAAGLLGGCARGLQAITDPSGAAVGTGSDVFQDLGGNDTASDIDRILARHPEADNAGDLRALREQVGSFPRVRAEQDQARVSAVQDHRAEHDRQVAMATRPPGDRFVLGRRGGSPGPRGTQDRRPAGRIDTRPVWDGRPRRVD